MSYAQRKELSGNRGVSIVMTVIVFGSLMYAIVSGLAYEVIKKSAERLKVIDVEQPPPPPKQPPPPPKDHAEGPAAAGDSAAAGSDCSTDAADDHHGRCSAGDPPGRSVTAGAPSAAATAAQDRVRTECQRRLAHAVLARRLSRLGVCSRS